MGANPSKPYDLLYCTTTLQSALVLGSQKLRSGGPSGGSMDLSKVYPWEQKPIQTYDIPYCTTVMQSTLVLGGQNLDFTPNRL